MTSVSCRHNTLNYVKGKSRLVFQDWEDGRHWEPPKGNKKSGKRDGAVGVRTDQLMLLASETDPNMAYESKNYGIAKYLHRTS